MVRYKGIRRVTAYDNGVCLGFSGDHADFQSIDDELTNMIRQDQCVDDGVTMGAKSIYGFLAAWMYQQRNEMKPLSVSLVVAGKDDKGEPFLGTVDQLGTHYEAPFVATGFGNDLALPVLRKEWTPNMSELDAIRLVEDCLRVCYQRDCKASNSIVMAKSTVDGVQVGVEYKLQNINWQ
ncbi:proteasome, subunit alpha/beta, partial [Kipferlia bialata]|eukprot:g11535.t1